MNQPVLKPRVEEPAVPDVGLPSEARKSPVRFEFSNRLFTLNELDPTQAESIRVLRTHVMSQHVDLGRRALSVVSVMADAGCSLVAANLAVALSQVGVDTLLIDGNLREPGVEDFIRPSQPVVGLRQRLIGPQVEDDCIQRDVLPSLSVMYSGGATNNAQELLAAEGFKGLMDQCLRDFQMTIVDTPAASASADTRRISSVLGYSLVVARQNRDRISDIRTMIAQLEHDGTRIIGTVLREV